METFSATQLQHHQPNLPKLVTHGAKCRRAPSTKSTRTVDSGYSSDPEISHSPLDFSNPDKLYGSVEPTFLLPPVPECVTDYDVPNSVTSRESNAGAWLTDTNCDSHLERGAPKVRLSSITSLSSSCSGGDYSLTEDSDFDDQQDCNPQMLSKAAVTTIQLVMRRIERTLNHITHTQHAGGKSHKGSGSGESSNSRRGPGQDLVSRRKTRGSGDGHSPEGGDDNGANKRRRISVTTTEDSESGPRFACPFYKHDPNQYRNRRTCPGPGWPTVHRMKEHLYRSHVQPIFCPRCYTMFDAENDLSAHLRADPCPISTPQPIDGIDRETLKTLRKRSPPLRLEEDKWREAYHLLFPRVPYADIPSPYYDADTPTEESRRFRRELLRRIEHELLAVAERENGPVEQRLLRQVAGIIQRCENQLLRDFYQESNPAPSRPFIRSTTPTDGVLAAPRIGPSPIPPRPSHLGDPPNIVMPRSLPTVAATTVDRAPQPAAMAAQHAQSSRRGDGPYSAEQLGQVSPLPWDSSEYIDWNAVFPPGTEQQGAVSDAHPVNFAMPVWT